MIEEKIAALLAAKFQEEAFLHCFPIEVRQNNTKLQVFIDSDEGVTFDTCQKVSRYLEQHLDQEGWLGEAYTLEVSSPGLSRPLSLPRQYPKHIGRRLEVTTGGATYSGTLREVGATGIVLEMKERRKDGKRKVTELVRQEILFDDIQKTIVKASF